MTVQFIQLYMAETAGVTLRKGFLAALLGHFGICNYFQRVTPPSIAGFTVEVADEFQRRLENTSKKSNSTVLGCH